ncbi:hypothetical protein HMPREF9374_3761 [Desmospora sp. 8437]|nr:hypothetical protein HMPREF9374_3761 [Desmospora sp. 8437]
MIGEGGGWATEYPFFVKIQSTCSACIGKKQDGRDVENIL